MAEALDVCIMDKERYLMNPETGTVETKENWLSDMDDWDVNQEGLTPQQQFALLIEVKKDETGDWVAV